MKQPQTRKSENGQAWVIMAVALAVLILMLGFAIDSAILFSNYTKLKRAVDAAAVAASNEYKVKNAKLTESSPIDIQLLLGKMTAAAKEMLTMHDLDMTELKINLVVYICDEDGDGYRDAALQTEAPNFYAMCPNTPTQSPRKLVYVQASEESPTYFMSLLGIYWVRLTTNSISEAAPIDLVLVFDTSESMGATTDTPGYVPLTMTDNFDPATCNSLNNCYPLRTAKDAAINLVGTLYDGYDQVAVVTFNQAAVTLLQLSDNMTLVSDAINGIQLHDDAPAWLLPPQWYGPPRLYNPVNPEDRDGDGEDADPDTPCQVTPVDASGNYDPSNPADPQHWLLQDKTNYLAQLSNPALPFVSCDKDNVLDAYDWNQDGMRDGGPTDMGPPTDVGISNAWVLEQRHMWPNPYNGNQYEKLPMSVLSTCTGCGIREATANLLFGRSNAVWVMVMLSDGVANMTDTFQTFPVDGAIGIPASYKNGFCGGSIGNPLWSVACLKPVQVPTQRYCINPTPIPTSPATPVSPAMVCPPNSSPVGSPPSVSPPYNAEDYARDMADRAALLNTTTLEPKGSDMAIYTIGLGPFAVAGEPLLRYMADVGDDGDRTTTASCSTVITLPDGSADYKECGQYYYTKTAGRLGTIFDNIASRIYTKITY